MVAQHAASTTRSGAGVAGRLVLTLLGAAGLVVGAFLAWWDGRIGTDLTVKALYQSTFGSATGFITSVGAVAIGLGLLAVLGLAAPSGWLTRLAGALGIVMFVLFAIQGYRMFSSVSTEVHHIGVGAWAALAGAFVVLVGGFLGRPAIVVAPATAPADTDL